MPPRFVYRRNGDAEYAVVEYHPDVAASVTRRKFTYRARHTTLPDWRERWWAKYEATHLSESVYGVRAVTWGLRDGKWSVFIGVQFAFAGE